MVTKAQSVANWRNMDRTTSLTHLHQQSPRGAKRQAQQSATSTQTSNVATYTFSDDEELLPMKSELFKYFLIVKYIKGIVRSRKMQFLRNIRLWWYPRSAMAAIFFPN